MSLRDQRQQEFADVFLQKEDGILYLCPRFGKCRVAIKIFQKLKSENILIAYPDVKIKDAWTEEFEIMGYKTNVTFTTHLSLKKHVEKDWDIFVIDEVHLLSDAQKEEASKIKATSRLALTGTMTKWTEKDLKNDLGLEVLARYPLKQAIDEGVITDYEIVVKTVPLDKKEKLYKSNTRSEKRQFDAITWVIDKIEDENKDLRQAQMGGRREDESEKPTFSLRLQRMRIIQNSIAKLNATKQLLRDWKDERVLVFCGLTKIADELGCPVYHSKAGEKEIFDNFAKGIGDHLAVVKIGNTGRTYKPLNRVLVNYTDSNGENLAQKLNRCMAMEYDNPDKKAYICIVSSNEPVELEWVRKALEFFDKEKIKYI